jgi:hypothetical protein
MAKKLFPGYRFAPDGTPVLFEREEDVPKGFTRTHPDNWSDDPKVDRDKPADGLDDLNREELEALVEADPDLDLDDIVGTGANGNVLVADIRKALRV